MAAVLTCTQLADSSPIGGACDRERQRTRARARAVAHTTARADRDGAVETCMAMVIMSSRPGLSNDFIRVCVYLSISYLSAGDRDIGGVYVWYACIRGRGRGRHR